MPERPRNSAAAPMPAHRQGRGRTLAVAALRVGAGAAVLGLMLPALHTTLSDPTEGSLLRVALRTSAGTHQDCRTRSADELAAMPMHMRNLEVCETRAIPYRLEIRIDQVVLLERDYRASGLHGDRPLVVNEQVGVEPGARRVEIRFAPVEATAPVEASAPVEAPPPVEAPAPSFVLEAEVPFAEGRIRVVTLDPATDNLTMRGD